MTTLPRAPLVPGDEAWCLLADTAGTASRSGERQTLRGAARVRIDAVVGDVYRVVVLHANGGVRGARFELVRAALYETRGVEHAAFGELVRRFWGRNGAPAQPPTVRKIAADARCEAPQLELGLAEPIARRAS